MSEVTSSDRINGYIKQLKEAEVSIDDAIFELPLKDQEKKLRKMAEAIPATPPPPAKKEEEPPRAAPFATEIIGSQADRMALLERELEESRKKQDALNARMDAILMAAAQKPENVNRSSTDILQDPGVIAALRNIRGTEADIDGTIRDGYVPPEDRMEEPVMVFANKSGIQIWFRIENGMKIGLPVGVKAPLEFKKLWQLVDPATQRMSYRAHLTINNRRVWEFIQKHQDFNKDFFESESEALRSDAGEEWAKSLSRYAYGLSRLGGHQLIAQAKALGLPTNATWTDQQYVDLLAKKFADDEYQVKHQAQFDKARSMAAERLLAEGAAVAQQ